jgi:hypothetical protein
MYYIFREGFLTLLQDAPHNKTTLPPMPGDRKPKTKRLALPPIPIKLSKGNI